MTTYTYLGMGYANPDAATQVANGISTSSLSYDNDGNLTSAGTSTYSWDYNNRMTQAVTQNSTSTYAYDFAGNRVSQTVGSTTTIYPNKFYSITSTTIGANTWATSTVYVWNGDTLIATIDQALFNGSATGSAATRYIHPDHLGSTNIVTDTGGNVVTSEEYYPYGETRYNEVNYPTNEQRQYIGQFKDGSNLSYLNSRYYDSARGQFESEDPIFVGDPSQQNLQDPQSLNCYSYSEDNPIVREDPLGKMAIGLGLGGGGNTPGLYGDASTFWVLTFTAHPFHVEMGTVTSGEGGGTTAILGASGSVRVMTSKNAQTLQDFQGWSPTGGVSGKLGVDIGIDFGASSVDDPNNKKGRLVDAETVSLGLGGVATPYTVPVEFHGGGSYSNVSNTTNLTPYITSAANSVKSGVQSSYAYIQAQINHIQQEINVLRQQISAASKSTNSK